jgi:prepilin-type N-terminal cleavage/methylation domain-containing protein
MRNTNHKSRITKRGFTIAELLLALAISAMLLAAIAVAFNASAINYRQNENIFKTVNSARQALYRITTQIRTAKEVYVIDETLEQCSMRTSDDQLIRYQYIDANDALYLEANGNNYVLCENVTEMNFVKTKADDNDFAESVQISMTVVSGDVQRKVSAAVVIRKNLK